MPRQLRVFLCHASQDKPAVRKLYTYLKQRGVQPWLDREDLLPGQDWEVEIPKALFNSDVILVCLSKNSVNKEGYVQKEIVFALDKAMEKPQGTIFIIPVKLEECDVPQRLSRYQWVDYYRTDGRKRLLMGLNVRAQGLGEEISPVVMEDSRQRIPRSFSPKPEIKEEVQTREEPEKEISIEIPSVALVKLPENKPVQRKPFTKILDPSTLNPSSVQKNQSQPDYRRYGIVGILLLSFVLGGVVLNSLLNKPPEATSTPISQIFTETPNLPTETSAPFTPTTITTETPLPSPTATTVLGIGSTSRSLKDDMVLVYVPAGEFTMGNNGGNDDEKPEHQVYLDAYWIDQTEVTNGMYAKCMEANKCNPPEKNRSQTRLSYFDDPEFEDYPVIYVSWDDAIAYCTWVGRELPTEAQWEKAARGTDGRAYPWGEDVDCDKANYYFSCVGDTSKVGSYPDAASIYGTLDMAGNVWEWVSSLYKPYPYDESDGREDLSASASRVLRGGSWYNYDYAVRSPDRNGFDPTNANGNLGFRCALSP